MMPTSASRNLTSLSVPPGAEGVARAHAALRAALAHGPAVAVLPRDDGSPHVRRQWAAASPDAPLESDDTAVMVTTSGSSGDPVGVLLGASQIRAAAAASHSRLASGRGRWVVAVPVTAVGGLMALARAIDAGLEPVAWPGVGGAMPFTPDSFLPTAAEALALSASDGAPAYVALVPTQVARLAGSPQALDALASFSQVVVGAAALPAALRAVVERAGVRVVSAYGASETCGGVVYDGVPLPGVTVSLDPDGLIQVGGDTIALGYRAQPALTAETFVDGRFLTADLGALDEGVLRVLGRADDLIKVGGQKVSLAAIADVVRAVEGVVDASVLAVDDDEWGQRPVIVVVGTAPEPTILTAVADSLGPTRSAVRRVAELPYLPNGKIDRRTLASTMEEH